MDSSQGTYLFFNSCRLCLDHKGEFDALASKKLSRDVYKITGIKILEKHGLPHTICAECKNIITKSVELVERARKNDSTLKTLFQIEAYDEPDVTEQEHFASEKPKVENVTQGMKVINTNTEIVKHEAAVLSVRKDLFDSPRKKSDDKVLSNTTVKCELNRLKRDVEEFGQLKCNICLKTFVTIKKLYLHSRVHNKSYICPLDVCEKKFATKGDLEKHLRVHTGVKPYQCDLCKTCFAQKGTLKSHKETVHSHKT